MRTSKLLVVVIVLQGLMLAGQWLGAPGALSPAHAQMPDPGRDRVQMIDELKSLNAKLDKLVGILESGDLQVHAVLPDETKGTPTAR